MSRYTSIEDLSAAALEFFLNENVLRFGDFTLKSGRRSPYFFNTGLLSTGSQLKKMGELYASLVQLSGACNEATVVFGSAYKGIPIAVATAIALEQAGYGNIRSVSDRKEAKTHGDSGSFLGVIGEGDKAIIVDDVITDGATKLEAIAKLKEAGVEPTALFIAFDRQEPSSVSEATAVEQFSSHTGLPVYSLLSVDRVIYARPDLADVLRSHLASFA